MRNTRNKQKIRRQRKLARQIEDILWDANEREGSRAADASNAARELIPVYAALAAQHYSRLGREVIFVDAALDAALGYQTPENVLGAHLPVWGNGRYL